MLSINKIFPNTPGCVFTFIGTVFIVVSVILLVVGGSQMLREQGYQSGQCTITNKQLQHQVSTTTTTETRNNQTYTHTTDTDVYAPHFDYTVRTADGHSYKANGYDGSDTFTSNQTGQQTIVDQYKTEQSYQCWYNPANPSEAILVRHPNWLVILLGGGFLLLGVLFAVLGVFLIFGLFRPRQRTWNYSSRG